MAAVTLLQETHVVENEAADMERQYRSHWGFNANAERMSFWSEATQRTGGVAILLNPYLVPKAAAAMEAHWTEHFMAITCDIDGHNVLILNVYAPSNATKRERTFRSLAQLPLMHTGPILLGGDFNCTQHWRMDRTYEATATSHFSPALEELLVAWGMADALDSLLGDDLSDHEIHAFHRRHHTYQYSVQGREESSRLDRWYLNDVAMPWFREVSQKILGSASPHGSDHSAVLLEISDPANRPRVRTRSKLYPPRPCAVHEVQRESVTHLRQAQIDLDELISSGADATEFIAMWEHFKLEVAKGIRTVSREALKKTKAGFRQRVRRLRTTASSATVGPVQRRAAIAALGAEVNKWQALKHRRLGGQHAHTGRPTTKEFFDRVSTKCSNGAIAGITATPGAPARAEGDVANRMADAWAKVFAAQPEVDPPPLFASTWAPQMPSAAAHTLDKDFTVSEIALALKRCKRTKSGGPDRLPNAWYRDHAEALAPILTELFNQCYRHGVCPASFGEATIVCLPKAGRTRDAMGYRPISLLNTDYKVLSKVLVARVKSLLPDLVIADQGGFVPGRDIHEIIDTFAAVQAIARQHRTSTVAVLLDIKKAYDSVHRPFLHSCLRQRGFSDRFCAMITATHETTTARFQVNGYLSSSVALTRGIRQGCPLAPLLFIMVLDPLYRWLRRDPLLREPMLELPGVVPPVAGFADDTAVYLHSESSLPRLLAVLTEFAAASGLEVNTAKSVAIRLWDGAGPVPATSGLRVLGVDEFCRYLGIQVGSRVTEEAVWQLTVDQLTCRLRLAERKTHSPAQRARLAVAIILPKCLFVARHHWPTPQRLDELDARIRSFVWDGDFVGREQGQCRRWMRQSLARLPPHQGGLGLPCIRTEVHTMATTAVASWAYKKADARDRLICAAGWTQGDNQLEPLTTLTNGCPKFQHGQSLWADGAQRFRLIRRTTLSPALQVMIRDGLDALKHQPMTWRWSHERYERDFRLFYQCGGREIAECRRSELGCRSVEWIPHMGITARGSGILNSDGALYKSKHLTALGQGQQVSDFVKWQWISPFVLSFEAVSAQYPLTNRAAKEFRELCDALVANFPELLQRPDSSPALGVYNVDPLAGHVWMLEGQLLTSYQDGFPTATRTVTSQHDLQHGPLRRVDGQLTRPSFACIPSLTKLVQVDMGAKPWTPARRLIKRALSATRWSKGLQERQIRAEEWTADDPAILTALGQTSWTKMLSAPGLSAYDSQLWHRLRLHQLLLWHPASVTSCPRASCHQTYDHSTGHVIWRCGAAQRLWKKILKFWGHTAGPMDPRMMAFGGDVPSSDRDWMAGLQAPSTEEDARLDHWIETLWRLLVTCAVRRLWAGQVRHLFPVKDRWADDFQSTLETWRRKCQYVVDGLYHSTRDSATVDRRIVSSMITMLRDDTASVPRFQLSQDHYLLFFDGGSRGNPGAGGSGSVIVRMSSTATVLWAASMAYNDKNTTNNIAEFHGLNHGLSALLHYHWQPATVIGDSNMILGLLRRRVSPTATHLKPLYSRALALTHKVHITGWHHHYRDRNKMADKAANIAMDTGSSFQALASTGRADFASITSWLASDTEPWLQARLRGTEEPAALL